MARSLFGWTNYASTGALASGSAAANMSIGSGWPDDRGSSSVAWQTLAGVVTSAAGAWATIDAGATATWRAFLLARTNLSTAATVRWRVGPAEAIIEEAKALDLNFTTATFVAPAGWNFARAGTNAGYITSAGQYAQAAANVLRLTYDPATLLINGALAETTRTNSIRNPRGEGAIAGSPGTLPTNWTGSIIGGLTTTISASTTDNGFPCAVLRVSGTPGSSGTCWVAFEAISQIAATVNQVWVSTCYQKVTAGSLTNTASWALDVLEYSAAPVLLATQTQPATPTTLPYGQSRQEFICTLAQATTAFIRPRISFAVTSGNAVDFTIELTPQCELGAVSSTLILPPVATPGASTRNADQAWITGLAVNGALGMTGYIDAGINNGTGAGVTLWGMTPASAAFADAWYYSHSGSSVGDTLLDSVHGNWTNPAGQSVTDRVQVRAALAAGPTGASFAVNGGNAATAANVTGFPGVYTIMGVFGAPWTGTPGLAPAVSIYRRVALYTKKLTNGQLKAITTSAAASTLDTAAATYDSGGVSAGIVYGVGQSVVVASADVSGRYARVDIEDAANTDGFINIPLAFAGPVWIPAVGADWQSSIGRNDGTDEVQTIGGQEYPINRWQQRKWNLALNAIASADVWANVMPLDQASRFGSNVLYIPDTASADIAKETILGRLRMVSDITYADRSVNLRAIRATIAERL